MMVDVAVPTERSKQKQHRYYSGKKHQHTLKGQVIIDGHRSQFICVAYAPGQVHDFKLLKEKGVSNFEGAVSKSLSVGLEA
jgi:hypothetical protein